MRLCIITSNVGKGDGQARVNYEIVKAAIQRRYKVTLVATQVAPDLKDSELIDWVYLSVKNYDFLDTQKNALFVLDFSSNTKLNDFAVQLGQFNQTRHLFHYEFQLLCLDASWFPFHLTLIFT